MDFLSAFLPAKDSSTDGMLALRLGDAARNLSLAQSQLSEMRQAQKELTSMEAMSDLQQSTQSAQHSAALGDIRRRKANADAQVRALEGEVASCTSALGKLQEEQTSRIEALSRQIESDTEAIAALEKLIPMYERTNDAAGKRGVERELSALRSSVRAATADRHKVQFALGGSAQAGNVAFNRTGERGPQLRLPSSPAPPIPSEDVLRASISRGINDQDVDEEGARPTESVMLYHWTARDENELTIPAGTNLQILRRFGYSEDDQEWWHVEVDGTRGFVPANYIAAFDAGEMPGSEILYALGEEDDENEEDGSANSFVEPFELDAVPLVIDAVDLLEGGEVPSPSSSRVLAVLPRSDIQDGAELWGAEDVVSRPLFPSGSAHEHHRTIIPVIGTHPQSDDVGFPVSVLESDAFVIEQPPPAVANETEADLSDSSETTAVAVAADVINEVAAEVLQRAEAEAAKVIDGFSVDPFPANNGEGGADVSRRQGSPEEVLEETGEMHDFQPTVTAAAADAAKEAVDEVAAQAAQNAEAVAATMADQFPAEIVNEVASEAMDNTTAAEKLPFSDSENYISRSENELAERTSTDNVPEAVSTMAFWNSDHERRTPHSESDGPVVGKIASSSASEADDDDIDMGSLRAAARIEKEKRDSVRSLPALPTPGRSELPIGGRRRFAAKARVNYKDVAKERRAATWTEKSEPALFRNEPGAISDDNEESGLDGLRAAARGQTIEGVSESSSPLSMVSAEAVSPLSVVSAETSSPASAPSPGLPIGERRSFATKRRTNYRTIAAQRRASTWAPSGEASQDRERASKSSSDEEDSTPPTRFDVAQMRAQARAEKEARDSARALSTSENVVTEHPPQGRRQFATRPRINYRDVAAQKSVVHSAETSFSDRSRLENEEDQEDERLAAAQSTAKEIQSTLDAQVELAELQARVVAKRAAALQAEQSIVTLRAQLCNPELAPPQQVSQALRELQQASSQLDVDVRQSVTALTEQIQDMQQQLKDQFERGRAEALKSAAEQVTNRTSIVTTETRGSSGVTGDGETLDGPADPAIALPAVAKRSLSSILLGPLDVALSVLLVALALWWNLKLVRLNA